MVIWVLDLVEGSDIVHAQFIEVFYSGTILFLGIKGVHFGLCPCKFYCWIFYGDFFMLVYMGISYSLSNRYNVRVVNNLAHAWYFRHMRW